MLPPRSLDTKLDRFSTLNPEEDLRLAEKTLNDGKFCKMLLNCRSTSFWGELRKTIKKYT